MKVARLVAGLVLAALTSGSPAAGPDREREARLRSEIVPNLVVGDAVDLQTADGTTFLGIHAPATKTSAVTPGTAVVLVHGSGVHPDWGFIGRLRMDLADQGFATLSIQMPVRPAGAPHAEYVELMPIAAARIASAAAWLQQRGHSDLVLVAHSLGSRMADAYFAGSAATRFRAWASLGIVGGDYSAGALGRAVTILDVYGQRDFDDVVALAAQRAGSLGGRVGSRQVRIDGADHFYAGREAELLRVLSSFLAR